MKRALAVPSLALAAACGSSEKPPPPVYGGFTPQGVPVPPGGVTDAGPGTYPYLAAPPTGPFLVATGEAAQVGAFCAPLAGSPLDMSGGSITIATVDSTHVSGSVSLTFQNGSVFQQAFDATICPVTVSLCSLITGGCLSPVCVP